MRRRPIGQILVERNEISEAELAAALAEQERTGLRLGQILIETGRISWLALARAIAEQVLDIDDAGTGDAPAQVEAPTVQVEAPPVQAEPEPVQASRLPPIPQLPDPAPPPPSAHFVPRHPAPAPAPEPAVVPDVLDDPALKLHSVEALLKERQRAFIELVTTTETLRMKVARLEEIIEERDRELTRLRVARAV